ncbi:hypothetical protein PHISP_02593 [Aspergillus sp. HF37]|nr:hypothetical protein PHISP_02593 [Aspergillus sp. HF37]
MSRPICTDRQPTPAQLASRNGTQNTAPPMVERPGNVTRFYRASASQGNESSRTSDAENTPEQEGPAAATLEETRRNALHTLAECGTIIATLEVVRIYKSRVGSGYWFAFWEKLYDPRLAHALGARASQAKGKINALFRAASVDLHAVTQRIERAVRNAGSEREILLLMERLEEEVGLRRQRRRKKAAAIMDRMRVSIENIPVNVTDELFDEMKRGVFALDVFCDYHPGDPDAEARERTGQTRLFEECETTAEYRRWLEASGVCYPSVMVPSSTVATRSTHSFDEADAEEFRGVGRPVVFARPSGEWVSFEGLQDFFSAGDAGC